MILRRKCKEFFTFLGACVNKNRGSKLRRLLPLRKVAVTGEKGLLGLFNVPFDEVDAKESEEADSEVFHPGLNGYWRMQA
jgi:hypothetical protein